MRAMILAALMALLALPVGAVQPDEVLKDPALEARAREISKELRCLVCRNESIDDSNADLARDLRLLVRERLVAGDSDAQVTRYLVDRYGEYVLLRPTFSGGNSILWLTGPALLLLGAVLALQFVRNSRRRVDAARPDAPLTAEEKARLDAVLRK